ncbi:MAG TPA: hypothetical protein PKG63_01790 [Bacteroidales bacterium]|nr:hypothetical protein [Bacteroidales bacterium]HOU97800.1 hypothetical protein [Bacteroidales bacterium]
MDNDLINLKKLILDRCKSLLNEKLLNAENEMKEAQQAANEVGPPKDRYDPFRSQMLRRRNLFAEQYQLIVNDMELLNKINPETLNDEVSFGAVVKTNAHRLFFAVSIGKIEINNETFFVASTQTPLFEVMKGKKVNESFEFNKNSFQITEVF